MVEKVMPKKKNLPKERFNTDNIRFTFFTRNKEDALEFGLFSLGSTPHSPWLCPLIQGFGLYQALCHLIKWWHWQEGKRWTGREVRVLKSLSLCVPQWPSLPCSWSLGCADPPWLLDSVPTSPAFFPPV